MALIRGSALRWLAVISLAVAACAARADCDIPNSSTSDKPYTATDVIASFKDSDCTLMSLDQDRVFYRYYSYPFYPTINIGRYLTLDFFTLNSEAIVELALYPFPPNVQFQNFAYYRERVLVAANVNLYAGLAGPQPPSDTGSCYAGGASQYFFAGADITDNTAFTFVADGLLTKDTRYLNEYGVGDPCNVPLPATWPLLAVGLVLLGRVRRQVGDRRPPGVGDLH